MDFYWETVLMLAGECGSALSKCLVGINVYVKRKCAWVKHHSHFHSPVSDSFPPLDFNSSFFFCRTPCLRINDFTASF